MGNSPSQPYAQWCSFPSEDERFKMTCCEERELARRPKPSTRPRGVAIPGFQRLTTPLPYFNHSPGEDSTDATNEHNQVTQQNSEVSPGVSPQGSRSTPSWQRNPDPLPQWTVHQQSILISQLGGLNHARKNPDQLKRVFENTHRLIPDKTLKEIEVCYLHLQSKRIAFFGPS
jgi:hypothetical protein